jgi:hypothetical protein
VRPDDFPELTRYRRVFFEDFEFVTSVGDRPRPVCVTRTEWRSGRVERRWLYGETPPPLDLAPDDLYVSYHAPAELCCRLVLGWPLPSHVIDLCVEFKRLMNGRKSDPEWGSFGRGLLDALLVHGIDAAAFADKKEMQTLAAGGGPFPDRQRADLLDYNERDVRALEKLLPAMLPKIDLPRALLRGRYMVEVAKIEHNGVPVNRRELQALADNWGAIRLALIRETDQHYGVWAGETFKGSRWERWVTERRLPWTRTESGRLSLHRDTFRKMAERYPEVERVRALRDLLSQLRHFELPVGVDDRTRCGAYTFGTITGRNAPKAHDNIFSWPQWARGLIQARPGRVLIPFDYAQQEYLIAGTLSGDPQIIADYRQGDVYIGLGKSLGLIPPWGDGGTHKRERHLCKSIALACNYGMGPEGLAAKVGCTVSMANDLLRKHHEKYARFWHWSDATVDYARVHRRLWTKYGWSVWAGPGTKETTWRNWRVQATGGEVLRVAVCALGAAGFQIDATVHDSVLLEAVEAGAQDVAREAERIMVAASAAVLGEPLRVDCRIVGPGQRLLECESSAPERGSPAETWQRIWRLLGELSGSELSAVADKDV